jgi:hypothetical protein
VAFTYNADRSDAVSRVRAGVGDITAPGLMPDATYTAALAEQQDNEAAAIRQMAALLAARYATEPDSISSDGSSLSWRERIEQWNKIALGAAGTTQPVASNGGRGARVGRLSAGCDYRVR